MNLDWLLTPIAQYGALALGLGGCLLLFLSAKMEMQSVRRMSKEAAESVDASVRSLSTEVQEIREGVRASEATSVVAAPVIAAPVAGLNLTKRAQALRMDRRGETVPTIAAALRAPQNEVELLLKLQRLISSQGNS